MRTAAARIHRDAAPSPTQASLVIIASAGHSGSTLLDLLLGNQPMISGAGEMNRLTLHAPDRVCACGATVTNCSYWNQVRAIVSRRRNSTGLIRWDECHTDIPPQRPVVTVRDSCDLRSGETVPESLRRELIRAGLAITERAVLTRHGVRDFKWHLTEPDDGQQWVLRPSDGQVDVYAEFKGWKNPVRLVPQPIELALASGSRTVLSVVQAISTEASKYVEIAENSWTVADAMATASGRPFVVDSSKSALRLKLLYMLRRDRVRIIHLVRDGRAVAASAMRRHGMPAARAGRIWKRDNQHLAVMLATVPSRLKIRVHYEAICEDPAREMSRIGDFLGVGFDETLVTLGERPVHNIPGNPMLFKRNQGTITKDERWRRALSNQDLAAFERAAGRLNRSFGYR